MRKNQFPRAAVFGLVAVFGVALAAPVAVAAQELTQALAPAETTWDESSGYNSVETNRAAYALTTSPSGVEASRVITAQLALSGGDLGSMQEEALFAVLAAGSAWDDASGYGAVEASRATVEPSQVTIDGYATP